MNSTVSNAVLKISNAAREYREMGREFPTTGVGNIIEQLEHLHRMVSHRYGVVAWTVGDLDGWDMADEEKLQFMREHSTEIQDLTINRINDAIDVWLETAGFKRIEE